MSTDTSKKIAIRKWKKAHPEKVREYNRKAGCKWRKANPERHRKAARKWQKAHPERHRKAVRKWQKAHPEKEREYNRKADRKWKKAHPEKMSAQVKAINKKTKATATLHCQKWDNNDDLWMLEHMDKMTATEMAKELGRTYFSIKRRKYLLRKENVQDDGK